MACLVDPGSCHFDVQSAGGRACHGMAWLEAERAPVGLLGTVDLYLDPSTGMSRDVGVGIGCIYT